MFFRVPGNLSGRVAELSDKFETWMIRLFIEELLGTIRAGLFLRFLSPFHPGHIRTRWLKDTNDFDGAWFKFFQSELERRV